MSTQKTTGILVAGVAIGLYAGWTGASLADKPRELAAPRTLAAAAPAEKTAEPLAPSLAPGTLPVAAPATGDDAAAERTLRLAAEKERDTLKAELALLKSSTATYADAMKKWGWNGEPREKLAKLDPDAAAKRLGSIGSDVDRAVQKLEPEKGVLLLRELALLGRPAWPLIEKLVTAKPEPEAAPAEDDEDDAMTPEKYQKAYYPGYGYTALTNELMQLVAEGELRDLAVDTLFHADSYSADFRRMLSMTAASLALSPDEQKQLLQALPGEKDSQVQSYMLYAAAAAGGLDGPTLTATLRSQPTPEGRLLVLQTALGMNGWGQGQGSTGGGAATTVSTETLRDLAQTETDPQVLAALRSAIVQRDPPVQGYLISSVTPGSQADQAGMKEGDILVSYNGSAVKSVSSLMKLKQGVPADASVPIQVYRDGVLLSFTLKAGQMGLNGQGVKPAAGAGGR